MKTVFKYPIKPCSETQPVVMPCGGKIVHVDSVLNEIYIWVELDPNAQQHTRYFKVVPTGQRVINYHTMTYVGTALCFAGGLVWHIYEVNL